MFSNFVSFQRHEEESNRPLGNHVESRSDRRTSERRPECHTGISRTRSLVSSCYKLRESEDRFQNTEFNK